MSFCGFSRREVRTGMTGAEGWAWYAWAVERQAAMAGAPVSRVTDGYLAQEIKKRLAARRAGKANKK